MIATLKLSARNLLRYRRRTLLTAGLITLGVVALLRDLRTLIDRITEGRFSIASRSELATPLFILGHDTYDGSCWLWEYGCGRRFLEAKEPQAFRWSGGLDALPGEDGPRLLGP